MKATPNVNLNINVRLGWPIARELRTQVDLNRTPRRALIPAPLGLGKTLTRRRGMDGKQWLRHETTEYR